jgi:hypothetical protein
MTDLERVLADLAAHPDSTAREIGQRLGMNDRRVFKALDNAAYDGWCQRWRSTPPRRSATPPSVGFPFFDYNEEPVEALSYSVSHDLGDSQAARNWFGEDN